MSLHIEARKEDIEKTVIMPGDPLRAKYIAENYLQDYKLVNNIRGMLAYTGFYKDKKVTVMASGMGMPSMGIYCYELYKFYDVQNIIRIGSCGAYSENIDLLETILVDGSYTLGNFALNFNNSEEKFVSASDGLNEKIEQIAKEKNISIRKENIACTECFDPYIDNIEKVIEKFPEDKNIVGAEMESFALFYTAKMLGKNAACLLTVVDSIKKKESLSAMQRQESLNDMINLALEVSIKS